MTDKKLTTRGTLGVGGTLGVSSTPSHNSSVSVEVRRRRFGNENAATAGTAKPADTEMARRLEILEQANKRGEAEAKVREEARKAANELQNKQLKAAEEARLAEEERKAEEERRKREEEKAKLERETAKAAEEERKKQEAAAPAQNHGVHGKKDDKSRKTLSLGNEFKKSEQEGQKKRGRNAYLGDLEARYRTMPGRRQQRNRGGERNMAPATQADKVVRDVEVPDFITVQELANRMAEKAADLVKKFMLMGELVTLNQTIDQETAVLIVEEFGHTPHTVSESDIEEGLVEENDVDADLVQRPPVVTVMGHVDHGKTTLLDSLRHTHVVKGEAGGITQHIGAYQVEVPSSGRKITFLDTPGHAAFTAMRARGAQVTDVVILVVAADDGVMPQTKEAIQHAKAAGVPIVVAINKMDKPDANPDRVKNELLGEELVLEDFGGEVPSVPVSALQGQGLEELEEVVLLQADLLNLQANPNRRADGIVVEAELDKGRGSVATIVVQRGTLQVGDILVAGSVWGRVRAMVNDRGENVTEAGPSTPVEVLGLQGVPAAGDQFVVVEDDKRAKEVAEYRDQKKREAAQAARKTSLDNLFDRMAEADKLELNAIVKGDVQGSVEAISQSLKQLDTPQVKVNVLHGAVGVVTETDINLAMASDAFVCAFNVRADATARKFAEQEKVEIRYYSVIYNLIDDIKNAMAGLLAPEFEEEDMGRAEVRQIFKFNKTKVAGCLVTEGLMQRGAKARIVRDGIVVYTGEIVSLRREKDEAKEVKSGVECGMTFDKYDDLQEGDTVETFTLKEVKKTFADLEKMAENKADKKSEKKAD